MPDKVTFRRVVFGSDFEVEVLPGREDLAAAVKHVPFPLKSRSRCMLVLRELSLTSAV